jgi:hypothetical protein
MELSDSSLEHTPEEDSSTCQFLAGKHINKRKKKAQIMGLDYILTLKHIHGNKAWYLYCEVYAWSAASQIGEF